MRKVKVGCKLFGGRCNDKTENAFSSLQGEFDAITQMVPINT